MIGVQALEMLQAFELKAFDHLMRSLPPESADQRILIVGADEEDISRRYGYPIPDAILAQLLDLVGECTLGSVLVSCRWGHLPLEGTAASRAGGQHLRFGFISTLLV